MRGGIGRPREDLPERAEEARRGGGMGGMQRVRRALQRVSGRPVERLRGGEVARSGYSKRPLEAAGGRPRWFNLAYETMSDPGGGGWSDGDDDDDSVHDPTRVRYVFVTLRPARLPRSYVFVTPRPRPLRSALE
eukprot:331581-Prorocentrum_minimum.AAC.1